MGGKLQRRRPDEGSQNDMPQSPLLPLQEAPNCESNPSVHAEMVLATQVLAKLFLVAKRAPQAHSSGAQGRWKVTSATRVRYKLDPEPPWETISPFRRLVPERVPDRAFCLMELVLLGPAA